MGYRILFLFFTFVFFSCASTTSSSSKVVDDDYGYSENNPIKVGGPSNGPANERKYLYSLTGLNGEQVTFVRKGSCCHFESKNAFGLGLLDVYEVQIKGDTVKKTLYLNMYDKDKLYAPKGFLMKK
ncbi:2-dehydro-3-deoxyphosphooctonate aldolase [Flavobacterium arcticum]|uniref:2-dehydro-3-deoxyphosphooctonate aldolase n=1 Tax=Flavobacterium arcticum TaxID=1784713 RepID=UPI0019689E11|nr:2-dehydro-3-deoxyphosphooctonate aldolase [Flavobacterium arcticum]